MQNLCGLPGKNDPIWNLTSGVSDAESGLFIYKWPIFIPFHTCTPLCRIRSPSLIRPSTFILTKSPSYPHPVTLSHSVYHLTAPAPYTPSFVHLRLGIDPPHDLPIFTHKKFNSFTERVDILDRFFKFSQNHPLCPKGTTCAKVLGATIDFSASCPPALEHKNQPEVG